MRNARRRGGIRCGTARSSRASASSPIGILLRGRLRSQFEPADGPPPCGPSISDRLRSAGVDVEVRCWDKPSNHAPAWVTNSTEHQGHNRSEFSIAEQARCLDWLVADAAVGRPVLNVRIWAESGRSASRARIVGSGPSVLCRRRRNLTRSGPAMRTMDVANFAQIYLICDSPSAIIDAIRAIPAQQRPAGSARIGRMYRGRWDQQGRIRSPPGRRATRAKPCGRCPGC